MPFFFLFSSQVLTRRRLLCRKPKTRRSTSQTHQSSNPGTHNHPSLSFASIPPTFAPSLSSPFQTSSSLSSSFSSNLPSPNNNASQPHPATSAAVMSREAFSWILKDLKSQVTSLVVEFLFLLDGGLLSNVAHDASLRHSSSGGSGTSADTATAGGGRRRRRRSERDASP